MTTTPLYMPAFDAFPHSVRRKLSAMDFHQTSHLMKSHVMDDFRYRRPTRPDTTVADLRDALHSIDSQMASLMRQKNELEARLERAVRSQSPVHRLPGELLSSMFVTAVLGAEGNPVMISTLMSVCRHWSEVALNTPILWAKITISQHHSLERTRRSLHRSKSIPLDVVIDFQSAGITEQSMQAIELLRPAIWRIKSMRICVPDRQRAHAVLLRCQEEAPRLETLTVNIEHSSIQDERFSGPLPLFNGRTPRLQSCSFTSFHFGWDFGLLRRLQVLKLAGYFNGLAPSPSTLVAVLSQCPELEELSLRNVTNTDAFHCAMIIDDSVASTSSSKAAYLPRLTTISFYSVDISLVRYAMSQIAFPNLTSLKLCYVGNITPVLTSVYNQALTRLPLRCLRIEACLFSELMLLNVLRHLPSLTSLEILDTEDISSNFMKVLSSPHPWVCPRLESLALSGCTSFEWDALHTVIESRLPPNPNAYARFHPSPSAIISSASASAAAHARSKALAKKTPHPTVGPQRLQQIDVRRCSQLSTEMIQWLQMYVAVVKSESSKYVWDDSMSR
ncbi:hypothetical protein JOM56_010732 [Amanita muscaria]